jgi:glutamine amidotransferase-like uncharacterized protein
MEIMMISHSRTVTVCALFSLVVSLVMSASVALTEDGINGQRPGNSESQKYALIYNGPISAEECPEAAAAIAEKVALKVRFVSDITELPLLLKNAAVFIIGGTGDDLSPLLKEFSPTVTEAFKDYLRNGGHYLGICGGGFVASTGWNEEGTHVKGLGIIPAKSEVFRQDFSAGILPVRWLGKIQPMFFKAGPSFQPIESQEAVEVIGYYEDGAIAALMCSYGKGKVAVCGPHPEARESWKSEAADGDKWISSTDRAVELLKDLLSERPIGR